MNTAAAVGEMVNAAFKFYGGKGDAGAVVLGKRNGIEASHSEKCLQRQASSFDEGLRDDRDQIIEADV